MNVGIAGAGNIGMGYAAFLEKSGHRPTIWSPSGLRTEALVAGEPLTITGAIEGVFRPAVSASPEDLAQADVIVLALPAYGHRSVLDSLVPFLEPRHIVIISGHLSFAALYLSKKLAERQIDIPIVAWNTTVLTCKPRGPNRFNVGAIRAKVGMATVPIDYFDRALDVCVSLFGDRFNRQDDLLSIALSNINPQDHLGMALCNLSRIEKAENWGQNTMVTPAIGRLLEAMDRERVAIAKALGKSVITTFDHFKLSYNVTGDTVSEISAVLAEGGSDPLGPTDLNTRYILEDVPFGIVPTLQLAKLAGIPAPLHQSGLELISACYGRDFEAENDLLPQLGPFDRAKMAALMTQGYRRSDPSPRPTPAGRD
ncbi:MULTISPECIES: NAD/NADP octopine/nopaline dehydrogenase family protein [unclassified Neorhizobium]|uniref:NAD/NADP octopine/nopaline dehydrogenase family protein n=1 Tax=unclassified Neorhizobium TaxID=2629175 RepID=UPI001FF6090E|nr:MULTISPECIES: NAD/NADP octopine/nopaline dehydrogenase family protein [unclassified Neorhizobium]MCJ9670348.1 NAD/NADP octopine/nopaline dehydrogenase family protein [Neorhizobium sp. SHOUNA12B]MCJ9746603.1 NAD/NADP octopine/nopaline dehydrogenase family protein [Neorhizobium sp. SHOUNA12A]